VTVSLHLTAEQQESLRQKASEQGIPIDEFLSQLVLSRLEPTQSPTLAGAIEQWARSHRHSEPLPLESLRRDSFYSDRG